MDKAECLANIAASAIPFTPFTPDGWKNPIYLRPNVLANTKEAILTFNADAGKKNIAQLFSDDCYLIERRIAKLMHDEKGHRLFDATNDSEMEELRKVLENTNIAEQIQTAQDKLEKPDKSEVDPEGN